MTPTIDLKLVDAPAPLFPMSGATSLPDEGLTTWFKTQPDWYENSHFKGVAIYTGGEEVTVMDTDDEEDLGIDGLLHWILEKQGHDFCRATCSITFS